MMSKEFSVLLLLLRSALWEEEPADLSLFPLTGACWQRVYRESQRQTVTALACHGLGYLPDSLVPPEDLLLRWIAEADLTERMNRRMDRTLVRLFALFRQNGFHPVLQKGQGVAAFYPAPRLRACGDIDLFFSRGEWAEALALIRRQGARPTAEADGSVCYQWEGIAVEHHPRLLDLSGPAARRFVERHPCDPVPMRLGLDGRVAVPAPWQNLLLLNTHILKHAMGHGIGLRQLCDMACACHRLSGSVDSQWMRRACQATGVAAWTPLLHAFLVHHLGLPACRLPYADVAPSAQPLAELVERTGNFGQGGASQAAAVSPWRRKAATARAFVARSAFSFRYAPAEAFWTVARLFAGQFNTRIGQ